jgi:hypothetical protein
MHMPTEARIGYGSTVEISTNGGSTWAQIDEVGDLTPPPFAIENPEVIHMQSPNRAAERVPGMLRMGQTTFPINFKAGSDADVLIRSLISGFTACTIRETLPNGSFWRFTGLVAGYEVSAPVEGVMTANVTFDASGTITVGSASAPVNSVLPAISGIAQVGQTLTAWPGIWTGAPTFAYQWELDGTPIVGAVNATYIPVTGDIGDPITVEVTATNSAGSDDATSVATANVIAA